MRIHTDPLIHSMNVQRPTLTRRTPTVDIARQAPVEPSIGVTGHDIPADDDSAALQTGDGLEGRAHGAREAGPHGVLVGSGGADGGGRQRGAQERQGEVVLSLGWVGHVVGGEEGGGEVVALRDGADDALSALLDELRRLVQRDAVVDYGGDLLRQGVGFDSAGDDVCGLGGLQGEAHGFAAGLGQFLGEGDVVAGLEGGGEPGLDGVGGVAYLALEHVAGRVRVVEHGDEELLAL